MESAQPEGKLLNFKPQESKIKINNSTEYIKILNEGFESPRYVNTVFENHATKVQPVTKTDYKYNDQLIQFVTQY
jgi:hypothetical protein